MCHLCQYSWKSFALYGELKFCGILMIKHPAKSDRHICVSGKVKIVGYSIFVEWNQDWINGR